MKFGITFDPKDKVCIATVKDVMKPLLAAHHDVILESRVPDSPKNFKRSNIKSMKVDFVISIGNSFNVLRTFREFSNSKIPVLSVSTSPTNFLPEITTDVFQSALEKIQSGDYILEEHSRLEIKSEGLEFPLALNEVVITSKKSATIVSYNLFVDDRLIFKDSSDGVIISTPTGSTGYSASAGGPVAFSNSKVFILTPIASLNQNRPIILNDGSTISIKSISSNSGAEIVIDGRFRTNIKSNEIKIKNSIYPARFVRFKEFDKNVLEKLRKRAEITNTLSINGPPSARFVFKVLQYEGTLTQKELIKMTGMSPRTVRSGLSYLIKNSIIGEQKSLRDTRYSVYYIINK